MACATRSGACNGGDRDALVEAFGADSRALHRRRPSSGGKRRARAHRDAGAARQSGGRVRRSATAPMPTRSWPWRSRTTRCRSCRTTGSSRISAGCRRRVPARRSRGGSSSSPARPRPARGRDRDVLPGRVAHAAAARAARHDADPIASLDVSVLQDELLAPGAEDRRRPHRQAHRLRRRRARHGRARTARRLRARGGGVFAVSRSASPT